jgi:hypothetical protein
MSPFFLRREVSMNIPPVLRSRTLDTSQNPPHSQYTQMSCVAGIRIIRRREGAELAIPFANYRHPVLLGAVVSLDDVV